MKIEFYDACNLCLINHIIKIFEINEEGSLQKLGLFLVSPKIPKPIRAKIVVKVS